MLPVDDQFSAWFTNREDEIEAWRQLLLTPAGEIAPSQVYIGVTGAGKTHLRRRFEQLTRAAGIPSVTVELDPSHGGLGRVDPTVLVHRLITALGIDAPRTTLALLRVASMESGDPAHESEMASELGTAVLASAVDALLRNPSIGGVVGASFRQVYAKVKRDREPLQLYLQSDPGTEDRRWILSQTDSSTIRSDLFRRLAEDLAEAATRHNQAVKVVLLVDSGEHGGAELPWLDRIIRSMSCRGIPMLVVGLFSQHEVVTTLPAELLQRNTIGGFLREDALSYCVHRRRLSLAQSMQLLSQAIEDHSDTRYHAYSLGLLCDAALSHDGPLAQAPEDQIYSHAEALTRRFLRDLEGSQQGFLRRLALVPTFDVDAGCFACAAGTDAEVRASTMRWLQSFSFVQSAGNGLWRLHAVMRRVLVATSDNEDNQRRHREWLEYWSERASRATDDASARAWYHLFALGLSDAMGKWNGAAEAAIHELRTDEHGWLVDIAFPLIAEDLPGQSSEESEARGLALSDWAIQSQKSALGERRTKLEQAVEAIRCSLTMIDREKSPANWASAQDNLGSALDKLGALDADSSRLMEAQEAFMAALDVRREIEPATLMAKTLINLGCTLGNIGARESDTVSFQRAVETLDAALEVAELREQDSNSWATAQNNKGTALRNLGERLKDASLLEESIVAFRLALEVFTLEMEPLGWAMIQSNLGNVLGTLGQSEENPRCLLEAVGAFESALQVKIKDKFPVDWASIQNNMGGVLQMLGHSTSDRASIERSVAAFGASLEVRTREAMPAKWAMTQHNLGAALMSLGELDRSIASFAKAKACFEAALEVFVPSEFPYQNAHTAEALSQVHAWLDALAGEDQV